MKHVSDGDLHAYLDGALEVYPEDEAQRIRRHLETCVVCGERLSDETALHQSAKAVLDAGDPGAMEVPAFEDLRRRAEAPLQERRERARRYRGVGALAWAATVVVSLGVGWLAGRKPAGILGGGPLTVADGALPGRAVDGDAPVADPPDLERVAQAASENLSETVGGAVDEPAPADAVPVAEEERQATVVVQMSAEATPAPGAPTAQEPMAGVASPPAPSETRPEMTGTGVPAGVPAVAAQELRVLADRRDELVALLPPDSAGTNLPDSTATARERVVATRLRLAPGGRLVAPELGPRTDDLAARRSRLEDPTRQEAARTPQEQAEVADTARQDAPGQDEGSAPLRIPGLEVVGIDWVEVTPGVRGIRVVQRLPGDTVNVELLFGGLDPAAQGAVTEIDDVSGQVPAALLAQELPDGVHQVVAAVEGGWVVIRGRVPEEGLRSLLRLLR